MLSFNHAQGHFLNTRTVFFKLTRVTQANEFTIIPVNKFIPALEPCATKENCGQSAQSCMTGTGCKVAVPYSFDTTPWANVPAAVTDRFAFWITNPSMAMFEAANLQCNGQQGMFALEAESSYQSIQVWRFDPYEFCPLDLNGVRRCPDDTSATFKTLPGFISTLNDSVCDQTFYVLAPTITYLDENNLVITVLETTFENVNVLTLRPRNDSLARYSLRTKFHPLLRWGVLLLFLFLHPLAFERILVVIHVELQHIEHILHVIPHTKMLQDARVHPIQAPHSRHSTPDECTHLKDTLLKFGLIPFVSLCDLEYTIAIRPNLVRG